MALYRRSLFLIAALILFEPCIQACGDASANIETATPLAISRDEMDKPPAPVPQPDVTQSNKTQEDSELIKESTENEPDAELTAKNQKKTKDTPSRPNPKTESKQALSKKTPQPEKDPRPWLDDVRQYCMQTCELPKITVSEPTLIAQYDPKTLGILALCGDAARDTRCLNAALQDGAQRLHQTDERLVLFYPSRFEAFIDAARERLDTPALEGLWSFELDQVIPGVNGRKIDIEASKQNFINAIRQNLTQFDLKIDTIPAHSANLPEDFSFKPSVKIGEYKTTFSRKKNRTHNVKLAAHALDGIFLMPDAEFSYNDWVGERSLLRGFREAPVIEQGQMVEGIGGGACQVSSTVHAAALLSGLDIRERYNHSLPSSYIPKGWDAVVSYPILDLRIRNNTERPVVLKVSIVDQSIVAQFYSDAPRTSKVAFKTEVFEEIPFKEVITIDPTLEPGTFKITKSGKVGYKLQRTRLVTQNGVETRERFLDDTYQPQSQLVSVAPDAIYPPLPDDPLPPEAL